MKIGLILSTTPSYSETFFNSKIKGLLANGHKVQLFVQKKNPLFTGCPVVRGPKVYNRNLLFQGVNFVIIGIRLMPYFKRLKRFVILERKAQRSWKQILKTIYTNSHLLRADLDCLHFGFATMALQKEHVAAAIGAKMAVSFRGYDLDVYPLKAPKCYDLLWRQVDKVHSISQYLLDKAYGLGLAQSKAYQIIPPAIDLDTFKSREPQAYDGTAVVQLLTIARLEWIKGLDYTLEALYLLKSKGLKFHYRIIGDGKEREALVYAIHQLGLQDEVSLISRVGHEEVVAYLSRTDIYIQYSHSEGFCNAVLEAQAMGCLCVVSDGGALPENIVHEVTGWLVRKRHPVLLADTINSILALSDEQKDEVRYKARLRVVNGFSSLEQQKAFHDFYTVNLTELL
ncbi:glycosyltransferase family 4 protein [Geojedonia litorea]|uniref:Glycosyltransferase family 4 protein n=1 Tax=Geojedonia litorea TaxID=1268269 RepID=A0ABV9MYU3_9FLAO